MMSTATSRLAYSGMARDVLHSRPGARPSMQEDFMADRPYARVYYSDLERDYPDVWHDPIALGTYVHLLAIAEAMWPAVPEVPRSARDAIVKRLFESGLLVSLPRFGYRIKGMDAERTARSTAARTAANARHGNADSTAPTMPNLTEPNRAEPSQADAGAWEEPEGEALTWLAKHGCYVRPGNGYHAHLVMTVEQHGINAVVGMLDRLARAGVKDGDTKGFVFGTRDALNPKVDLKGVEAEVRAEERETARRNRKPDPTLEAYRAAIVERYGPEEQVGPGVVKAVPS